MSGQPPPTSSCALARVFVRRAPVPLAGGPFSGVAVSLDHGAMRTIPRRGNHCSFGVAKEYVAKPRARIMSCLFTPQCGSCKKIYKPQLSVFITVSVLRKPHRDLQTFPSWSGRWAGSPTLPLRGERPQLNSTRVHGLRRRAGSKPRERPRRARASPRSRGRGNGFDQLTGQGRDLLGDRACPVIRRIKHDAPFDGLARQADAHRCRPRNAPHARG
jgi:hypothetical protein